jgi:hypothetical protein
MALFNLNYLIFTLQKTRTATAPTYNCVNDSSMLSAFIEIKSRFEQNLNTNGHPKDFCTMESLHVDNWVSLAYFH